MKIQEGDTTEQLDNEVTEIKKKRLQQKEAFNKQMTDYRAFLQRQQQVKKQTQEANSKYWRL